MNEFLIFYHNPGYSANQSRSKTGRSLLTDSRKEAENYCLSLLAGERLESFYVIVLNTQCNVLGKRKISIPYYNSYYYFDGNDAERYCNENVNCVFVEDISLP